jgi:hypothetical protein
VQISSTSRRKLEVTALTVCSLENTEVGVRHADSHIRFTWALLCTVQILSEKDSVLEKVRRRLAVLVWAKFPDIWLEVLKQHTRNVGWDSRKKRKFELDVSIMSHVMYHVKLLFINDVKRLKVNVCGYA